MENFKKVMDEEFKISVIGDILVRAFPIVVVYLVIIVLSIFFSYTTNLTVSMYPVIEEGSGLIGLRQYKEINRGDIVSFKREKHKADWVKRVLGLPGETIEFKDNDIYIDGKIYHDLNTYQGESSKDQIVTLKNDEYFLVGDNRDMSEDSRTIGPIKEKAINSKIIHIFNLGKSLGFGSSEMDDDTWSLDSLTPSDLKEFNK